MISLSLFINLLTQLSSVILFFIVLLFHKSLIILPIKLPHVFLRTHIHFTSALIYNQNIPIGHESPQYDIKNSQN